MKKSKLIILLSTLAVAFSGVAAVCGGVKANKVEETSANGGGSVMYVDINAAKDIDTWKNGNLWLRYWDGSKNGFEKCEQVNKSKQFFKITLRSAGYGSGGFCFRCENTGSDDWKETKWISWSSWSTDGHNALKLTGQDGGDLWRWTFDKVNLTEYSTYIDTVAKPSTFRVFTRAALNAGIDWWYNESARTCIRYTVGGVETLAKMNTVTAGGLFYWYADIPLIADGYQFIRVSDGECVSIYNYTVWTENTDFTACDIRYILNDKSGNDQKLSTGGPHEGIVSKELAKVAIENLLTCSNSKLNGYGVYQSLYNHFVKNLSDIELEAFRSMQINDYSYDDYSKSKN